LLHRPLTCSGRWIGGLLYPVEAAEAFAGEAAEAMLLSMSFAAAALSSRDGANALAEQLAQSSQKLYDAQRELTDTRALAAVGEMAAGAAHEINNPLAIVAGRAQLMADSAPAADRQIWKTISEQAQRISDIVTEMMDFARPGTPSPESATVGELLDAAHESLADVPAAKSLTIESSIAADVPKAFVDRKQLTWVLTELMTNAAEAQAERAVVRVEAEGDELTGDVLIRVIDRGSGMDPATVDKAFSPFFSAKPAGRKRGMGLSKARRLVQLAGGKIWIHSAPQRGTTVFMLLPRAEESAQDD
jgi:signal transduction histidine kinase